MRRGLWAILGLSCILIASAFGAEKAPDPYAIGCGKKKLHEMRSNIAKSFGYTSPYTVKADSIHDYDAQNLDIVLTPDIENFHFDGIVTMSLEIKRADLEAIKLYLAESAAIASVKIGDQVVSYTREGDEVVARLAEAPQVGAQMTLKIEYQGVISLENHAGGMIYDSQKNVLYTFGEPYDTRKWIACFDFPFDKVTSRMTVRMDDSYKVLSNGELEAENDLGDGIRETIWVNNDPVSTYLISIAAHPYTIIEGDAGGAEGDVPVNFWVYPDWLTVAEYEFARTGEMITYFGELYGDYPFNKYDQAMAPIFGGWGAMEHQTCTTYGDRLVIVGERSYENIVAHELSHQWWGDWVGPLSFKEIWLNEGFASYSEALWAEHESIEARGEVMDQFATLYFYEDQAFRFPVYDPPYDPENNIDQLFSYTVYKKGAWVLHMLRWVLGDEDFFSGLRYYGANETHAFGSATTEEFIADMETVSEKDLTAFFDEWVYSAGYPIYSFADMTVEDNGSNGYDVEFSIKQDQQDAGYFTTPLPIHLFNTTQDTIVRTTIPEGELGVYVRIRLENIEFSPTSLELDPEGWILCVASNGLSVGEPNLAEVKTFELTQFWPNPFNATTNVKIALAQPLDLRVRVFDILGREVVTLIDGMVPSGVHRVAWEPAVSLPSGVYLIQVSTDQRSEIRRVTLLK